jgi:hypothetical protein
MGLDHGIMDLAILMLCLAVLPQGHHEATGGEGNKLLQRALQTGAYIIKKPVNANEVRSLLWKVIAFRKSELETKARRGFQQGAEDEGHGHKVVTGGCRKRTCSSSSNPAGGSFFAGTAATAAAG